MNPTPIQLLHGLATEVNLALDELAGSDRRRAKERILPFFAQLENTLNQAQVPPPEATDRTQVHG